MSSGGAGGRINDAELRRLIDEAKARHNLSDVVGRHTTLRRRGGREKVGICPFHKEKTASFEVNDAKGVFHCHGCGKYGDHMTILRELEGMTFRQAVEVLTGDAFPTVDPAQRAKAAEEDRTARTAAIDEARAIWAGATSVAGTPAEAYLRSRGIVMSPPPTLRFARVYSWRDDSTGEIGPSHPALIGAVTNRADEIIGLQRIFLSDDGKSKRWARKSKFSLGRPKGGALRLDAGRATSSEVIITEGPEDGLSLAQELPAARIWVALGTAMMPAIEFTPDVRRVIVAGQNDNAGRDAAEKAAASTLELGFEVRTMFPDPAFKDWNDQLRGARL